MSQEKQIEEMARKMCRNYQPNGNCASDGDPCGLECIYGYCAERIYCAGYRKQSEGEWEVFGLRNPKCSLCRKYNIEKSNFCPNCGAKMKGGEE